MIVDPAGGQVGEGRKAAAGNAVVLLLYWRTYCYFVVYFYFVVRRLNFMRLMRRASCGMHY